MTVPYTPVWQIPSAPGQLSNQKGTAAPNADAMFVKARYKNPAGATDTAGTVRAIARRVVASGVPITSQVVWDSGVVGQPSLPPIPAADMDGPSCILNGRVYYAMSDGSGLYSAMARPQGLGAWRPEIMPTQFAAPFGKPGVYVSATTNIVGTVIAPGTQQRLFITVNLKYRPSGGAATDLGPALYTTTLLADGSISGWDVFSNTGSTGWTALFLQAQIAVQDLLCYVDSSGIIHYQLVDSNTGQPVGSPGVGPTTPAVHTNAGLIFVYDPRINASGYIYLIGGDAAGTAVTTIYRLAVTIDASDGTVSSFAGSWTTLTTGLPAAREQAAVFVSQGNAWCVGGAATANGAGTNTIYRNELSNLQAGSAWTTDAKTLLTAVARMSGSTLSSYNSDSAQPTPWVWAVFGGTTSGVAGGKIATVQGGSQATNGSLSATYSGLSPGLVAGDLGSGGTLVVNSDGSQDFGFNYGAFGTAPTVTPLSNGDQIELDVQFGDIAAGDLSPFGVTTVKVGQPPTLSATSPANASTPAGAFTASFSFTPGAGGAPEASWRIKVQQPAGTNIADSGTVYGSGNSYASRPTPIPSTTQTGAVVFTASSQDIPMSGSTNTVTQTNTVTYTGTAPGTPTGITAVADNVNGLVTVGWTSGASTATNRIYYRRNGTGTWLLAADRITSTGSAQTVQIVEPLALKVPYDFAVAGVSSTPVEGTKSTAVTNVTILPEQHWDLGGYSVMLSVAGSLTLHAGLIPKDGTVQIGTQIANETTTMFGQRLPSTRTGIMSVRSIALQFTQRVQDITGLDAVLEAALTGSVLVYRDIFPTGDVIYCTLDPKRSSTEDLHVDRSISLIELQHTFTP